MPLPSINTPLFQVTLPSTNQQLTIRQIYSGEYKALLNSVVIGDNESVASTISQILKDCIQEPIDVGSLYYSDVEYLVLKLYAMSAGQTITVNVQCNAMKDDGAELCGTTFALPISIDEILPPQGVEYTKTVNIDGNVGLQLKYPNWRQWNSLSEKTTGFDAIKSVIASVFDTETVYTPEDYTEAELTDFIDKLPRSVIAQITEFINNAPTVRWQREVTCPTCKNTETMLYEGLSDFFG